MNLIFLIVIISCGYVSGDTGVNCCPGIATKPVTPETCASGAENQKMCLGTLFTDCECTGDYAEIDNTILCDECSSKDNGLLFFIIVILPIICCVLAICLCVCCCKRGNNQNIYQNIRYGKVNESAFQVKYKNGIVHLEDMS